MFKEIDQNLICSSINILHKNSMSAMKFDAIVILYPELNCVIVERLNILRDPNVT